MIDFVRLNNRVVSAKSLSTAIGGVPYQGIVAAKYSEKIDKEHVYDNDQSGGPVGMTSGKYMPEDASITMLKDVFTAKFLPQFGLLSAANLAPGAWGQAPPFPVSFTWFEPPIPPALDLLSGCEIIGAEDDYAEGINAAVVVIALKPMSLSRNGLTLYNRARSLL
jgi:hypothetical protein